uniref:Uncharacterized protein n=1 Tax=Oryza brachyantha TaxID=4533 RepID=J3LZF6_ORYBR
MESKSFLSWTSAIALHPPPASALSRTMCMFKPFIFHGTSPAKSIAGTQNLHGSILNWTAQHALVEKGQ